MAEQYTYTSSPDFINDLIFDYVETYSFQRGAEYEVTQKRYEKEYDKLKAQKLKNNYLSKAEEDKLIELTRFCGSTQYLVNENNQFHYSNKKLNTFSSKDPKVELLKTILRTEIKNIPSWLCSPIYRDALVFINSKGKIVSVLNVCLSCQYMETTKFHHINGDFKTYDMLKDFFIEIGHTIEKENEE